MIRDPAVLDGLLATIRRFVEERLMPAEAVVEETNAIPQDILTEMKTLGLFGMSIPEAYWRARPHHGGRGVMAALGSGARRRPSARSSAPTTASAHRASSPTGRKRRRPIGCRAWPRAKSSLLRAHGTRYRVGCGIGQDQCAARGRSLHSQWHQALHHQCAGGRRLHADGADRRARPFRHHAFLVRATRRALSLGKIDNKMGQRGTRTCDVFLDDARVSPMR